MTTRGVDALERGLMLGDGVLIAVLERGVYDLEPMLDRGEIVGALVEGDERTADDDDELRGEMELLDRLGAATGARDELRTLGAELRLLVRWASAADATAKHAAIAAA